MLQGLQLIHPLPLDPISQHLVDNKSGGQAVPRRDTADQRRSAPPIRP
jgi:hypothetical protein